jgi:miniconductance mechanosensitive channel
MQLLIDPGIWFKELFIEAGLSYSLSIFLSTVALVVIVIVLSWLSNLFAKVVIMGIVTRVVKRTTSTWDDVFLEKKVFTRLSHLAPALVIWFMAAWALKNYPIWLIIVHKFTYIYLVTIGTVVVIAFIEAWHEIYNTLPISRDRHIKGYVQLIKIFVVLIAVLIVISVVFKKDISTLLAGLGAMAAVLILVFKDTLLGLVGSIQLSSNKMLKVGDWITIPGRDVDGVVTDISLNTVKVQNFDKTIITVPTYSLVNESFQNWNGMEESGLRRIKRAILIDMRSVKFLDDDLRNKLCQLPELKEFIEKFERKEIGSGLENTEKNSPFFNSGRITNLGIFRFYAEAHLRNNAQIDENQIIMLRHRDPDGNGLPLQIIVYSNKTDMVSYENLQSEIFEHLLAILNEFELKVFQQPTGDDFLSLLKNTK